jgi:hypothetical protein
VIISLLNFIFVAKNKCRVKQSINFWLDDPDANGKKPDQEKLACKVAKCYESLQLYCL